MTRLLVCTNLLQTVFNIRLDTEAGYVDLGKGLADLGVDYRHCPIDYDAPTVRHSC